MNLANFKLPFGSGKKKSAPKPTKEEVTRRGKARWLSWLGMKGK